MELTINVNIIPYVLNSKQHIEYFLWCYLRTQNKTGFHSFNSLDLNKFCEFTLKQKSHNCVFYQFQNNNFILKSRYNLNLEKGKVYKCDFNWINNCVRIEGYKLNSTTIKYFLIAVYACRHESKKPYALRLISEDLDVSISTIQRALKFFDVNKHLTTWHNWSPRGYTYNGVRINLSPNFNFMLCGKFSKYNVY